MFLFCHNFYTPILLSWLADKTSGEFMKQLHIYIGAIVRLANQNPFEDVRILLGELVDFLKVRYKF